MAGYYTHTYVLIPVIIPSFVKYFEDQEKKAQAWREDMGQALQNAAINAAYSIDQGPKERVVNHTLLLYNNENFYINMDFYLEQKE